MDIPSYKELFHVHKTKSRLNRVEVYVIILDI